MIIVLENVLQSRGTVYIIVVKYIQKAEKVS